MRRTIVCLSIVLSTLLITACSGVPENQVTSKSVTEADYKAGVAAAAQCMRRAGFEVGELTLEPNGWRWSFSVSGLGAGASEADRAAFEARLDASYNECIKEHIGDLENAYRRSRIVPPEQRAIVMEKFLECARQAGLDTLEPSDTEEDIETKLSRAESDVYAKVDLCRQQFEGLWPESIPE